MDGMLNSIIGAVINKRFISLPRGENINYTIFFSWKKCPSAVRKVFLLLTFYLQNDVVVSALKKAIS